MKRSASCGIALLLLLIGFCMPADVAMARLPKPIKATGVVLALDLDTRTLVLKQSKDKKPCLLDWNKQTEFITSGRPVLAAALKQGTAVVILYKEVSFHNPLLKKVMWDEITEDK